MPTEIIVVGSMNVDWIVRVPDFPRPGETLLVDHLQKSWGGKGANQAVAIARLGGSVRMLGKVGDDPEGREYVKFLSTFGVIVDSVQADPTKPTGRAIIYVNEQGENQIVVVAGANYAASPDWLMSQKTFFQPGRTLLLQLELPVETVETAIEMGYQQGMKVVLNPAPAKPIRHDLYAKLEILVANEQEAMDLSGLSNVEDAAGWFLKAGCKNVVITRGKDGLIASTRSETYQLPARKVEVKDTTGAGDCFVATLTWAVTEGMELKKAVELANRAASLSVTKEGTISSYPTNQELRRRAWL